MLEWAGHVVCMMEWAGHVVCMMELAGNMVYIKDGMSTACGQYERQEM
jgi:hypothetical protein